MEKQKLTLSEMAARLQITPKTFNKYVELYQIPFLGLGRNKRFDPEKVEKHLEKVEVKIDLPELKLSKKKIDIGVNPQREYYLRRLGL